MIEKSWECIREDGATTRRGMLANGIQTVVGLGAAVAGLATIAPAQARNDRDDDGHDGGHGHRHGDDRDDDGDHGHHHGDDGGHGHPVPCFLRGTPICTVDGERRVEEIAVGDLLPTAFCGPRPVEWVGHWQCRKSRTSGAWKRYQRPVRIARSALGPDIPHTDLFVSQRHAIFIEGVLVPAGSLVNGRTIALCRADEFDALEYFHLKLASHTVIYAAGALCETLHTAAPDTACAPVLCSGRRSRLLSKARSIAAPWLGPQQIDLIRARLLEQAALVA
jgi:Hint domain